MKVLDLFCGRGGWSKPFVEAGDDVVGIDIVDVGYPGKLILKDVREVNGKDFRGYGFIIGSPPCNHFSQTNGHYKSRNKPDIKKGLELIHAFNNIVDAAAPKFNAMENVRLLERYYYAKPIWHFFIGSMGRRSLWGNIPIPLANDYRFPYRILRTTSGRKYAARKGVKSLTSEEYAEIPRPIAQFIHDCVKSAILEAVET